MTAVELAENLGAVEDCGEFPHVLDGVVLIGAAARLARMLDRRFLDEAGWDPRTRVLSLPADHRLLGRTMCRVEGCQTTVHSGLTVVCHRCFSRLNSAGDEQGRDRGHRSAARRARVHESMRSAGMPVRADSATRGLVRAARQEVPASADHRCRWTSFWLTRGCGPCRRCRLARLRRAPGPLTAPAAIATLTTSAGGTRCARTTSWIRTDGRPANREWPSPGR